MNSQATLQSSKSDVAVAAGLAAFSMFVVGYTATRVFLSQPASTAVVNAASAEVVSGHDGFSAHQASMWNVLGH